VVILRTSLAMNIDERILLRLSLNFSGQRTEPEPLIDCAICSLNAQKEQNPSSPSSSAQRNSEIED
jgi:hypothetical protein